MYMIIDGVFRSDKKQVDEYKQLLRPLIHYDRRTGTFPLWCVWSWWQSALYTASQWCLRAVCRVATRLGVQCSRASRAFCVSLIAGNGTLVNMRRGCFLLSFVTKCCKYPIALFMLTIIGKGRTLQLFVIWAYFLPGINPLDACSKGLNWD